VARWHGNETGRRSCSVAGFGIGGFVIPNCQMDGAVWFCMGAKLGL
jgi:hypothetical protein